MRAVRIAPATYVFLSDRTHVRRNPDKTDRNVNMFVYHITCRPFGGSRAPCPPPLSPLHPLYRSDSTRDPIWPRTPERDTRTGGWGIARASHFPLIQDHVLGFPTCSPSGSPYECHVLYYPVRACVACVVCTRAAGRVLVIVCMCANGTMCLASSFELIN